MQLFDRLQYSVLEQLSLYEPVDLINEILDLTDLTAPACCAKF
jgi:hypothetical protein